MTSRRGKKYCVPLLLFWLILVSPLLRAQAVSLETTVTDASSEVVYLNLGSTSGIQTGDTLVVFVGGSQVGSLRVLRTTDDRLVAVRIESDLVLARDDRVEIRFTPHIFDEPNVEDVSPDPVDKRESLLEQVPASAGPASRSFPQVSGRITVGIPLLVSSSSAGSENRLFATPFIGWRSNLEFGPREGGISLDHNIRVQYRYADLSTIEPETSFRIYSLRLKKEFASLPLSAGAGRFRPEFESYSGYWDGGYVDVGSYDTGFSILAGYQPLRGNEALSAALPKLAATGRWQTSGSGIRYRLEATMAHLLPNDVGEAHTYGGLSQYFILGRFRLVQRLRIDQGLLETAWKASQLLLNASYRVSNRFRIDASYNLREPFFVSERSQQFGLQRNDWRLGANLTPGRYTGRIEYAHQSQANRADSWMINTNWYGLEIPSTRILLQVHASYWTMETNESLAFGGSALRTFNKIQARAGLRRYRYDFGLESRSNTQTDVGITYRPAKRLSGRINWQSQFGSGLAMNRFQLGFYIQY